MKKKLIKDSKEISIKNGKLIVVDGIDGSGKAMQTELLVNKLKKAGVKVKTIDFPRYGENFFGNLIGNCLIGKHGDFISADPHIVSVLYAADRNESSRQIRTWLDSGYTVITDRYVSANQIHQGGKIHDMNKRKEFMNWLDKMEYKVFGIPKPDLVIYLDVPFEVSSMWLKKKVAERKKKYLDGNKDVAEENLKHLKDSRDSALQLAKENKNWERIECCSGMICMPPEGVAEKVFEIVSKKLSIKK